jgi:hypothetical protein
VLGRQNRTDFLQHRHADRDGPAEELLHLGLCRIQRQV